MTQHEKCEDCPYYYGEVDCCMYGEEGAPTDLPRNCEEGV